MLYGEVFADEIYPICGEDPIQPACVTGTVNDLKCTDEIIL